MTKKAGRRAANARLLSTTVLKPAAVALVIGAAGMAGFAPGAALAQSYSFSSVQIEGLNAIDPGTVTTYLGFSGGESVSQAELNDAYQRLSGSGLFESVQLVPSGNTLVVRVTEYPLINRINVEGNKRLKDEDLLAMLQSKPRYVFNPAQAEADADTIATAYSNDGRIAASVTPK